ncbi:hypothetical protein FRC08_004501 [Ceratobasidium sp. 394]|nr:hypothetical protein FRC08_004501 [Ceratobasidium sp. 394]
MDTVSPTTPALNGQPAPVQDASSPKVKKVAPITKAIANAKAARRHFNMVLRDLVKSEDLRADISGASSRHQSSVIQAAGGQFGRTTLRDEEYTICHIWDVPKYDRYGEIRKAPRQQRTRAKKAKDAGLPADTSKHNSRVQSKKIFPNREVTRMTFKEGKGPALMC